MYLERSVQDTAYPAQTCNFLDYLGITQAGVIYCAQQTRTS